jgi:uncharacterized protein (DUF58 family)
MRPTPRAALLFAAGFPLALLPAVAAPALWVVWAAALGATLALVAADWLLAAPVDSISLEADAPRVLYLGEWDALRLRLTARGARGLPVEVLSDLDPALHAQPPVRVAVGTGPEEATEVEIPLVPRRRGTAEVLAAWLRWTGPFGLLRFTDRRELKREITVLPNIRAVRAAALRFFGSRRVGAGLKIERYLGDGSEFESLREHRPGLDARSLDWKASARHHKLLSREYRAERNHAIVVALDTGYLMGEPLAGIPKLDHGINAALLLAYVALKTGDRVGLLGFDDRPRLVVEPRGGVAWHARLQREAAGLEYSQAETNFTRGLLALSGSLRRRSLVVVMTDFVDSVTAELMVDSLQRAARSHFVLFVSLRDVELDAMARAEPVDLHRLNRAMTAHDLLREREAVLRRLRRAGVDCIDAAPGQVGARLVNRYLDVKRRELV